MACIQSDFNILKTWNWRAFLLLSLATIVPKQGLSADCSLYWWVTDLISNWLRLAVCCELMNNTENVWTMVELAALTRMFEKVYLICTSGKRNQWKWTLQTNYTYYFGRSDRNVTKVTSFNVKTPIVQKGDKSAIHWINLDLVGTAIDFRNIYPLYVVLFNRWTATIWN